MNTTEVLTEDKRTGSSEGKLFNESCHSELCKANRQFCHPELDSGSVHSGKRKLPWDNMLKQVQHDKCAFTHAEGATHVTPLPTKAKGFTLAEVLITLGIIGVVAAITIPTLVQNMAERSNSEKEANTVQKIAKSMDLMRADGKLLVQYPSTDAFVDELVKYLRVTTRCDANNIAKCWPTDKVITSDGEEYEVKKAKKGIHLQKPDNKSNNVGLILNDGTSIILSYNENAGIISDGDTVTTATKPLPIGFGKTKEFVYSSSVMAPIAFVMDVNGFRGPNSETRNGKMYDIRSYNLARFSTGCPTGIIKTSAGTVCLVSGYPATHAPVDCSSSGADKPDYKYCGTPSGLTDDYWAGAKKACEALGMTLPDKAKLQAISATHAAGLSTAGDIWSSTEINSDTAYYVNFYNDGAGVRRKDSNPGALCLE